VCNLTFLTWLTSCIGIAARIGQRIGLHRDPENLGLSPFECEMRRRLWYQIMMQDGFAEKLAGTGGTMFFGEVRRPSNLNDSDLFPNMKELPQEHEGATEMMFFLIRCHLGNFLRNSKNPKSSFDGVWNTLSGDQASLEAKDKAIDELESLYQRKFLDYCDRNIPWHFMCTYLSKGVVAMLRFIAHCPDGTDTKLPQSEKDKLFEWAVSVVRWQNMAYTTKEMQGCLWHINSHFQWKAFVYFVTHARPGRRRGVEGGGDSVRFSPEFFDAGIPTSPPDCRRYLDADLLGRIHCRPRRPERRRATFHPSPACAKGEGISEE
jgi:hypothetical protein